MDKSLLGGLILVLISTVTRAQAPYPGLEFRMIELAAGESARLKALNRGTGSAAQNSSCSVTLQFLGRQSRLVKERVVTLPPGKAASLDVDRRELPGDDPRGQIRAVLIFGYYGGAPPGPRIAQKFNCNIAPNLEVYDQSGSSRIILTEAKPLPAPSTPAQ
jgi:hypothetical protein